MVTYIFRSFVLKPKVPKTSSSSATSLRGEVMPSSNSRKSCASETVVAPMNGPPGQINHIPGQNNHDPSKSRQIVPEVFKMFPDTG